MGTSDDVFAGRVEGIAEKERLKESDSRLQILEEEEKVSHLFCVFLMLELGQKMLA